MVPLLDAPRALDLRSVDGLREPLKAELLLLRLRFAAAGLPPLLLRSETDGLRKPVLLFRARSEVDGRVLGVAIPRSLDCKPDARLDGAAAARPRAWSRVTRLDPLLAPYFFATSEFR